MRRSTEAATMRQAIADLAGRYCNLSDLRRIPDGAGIARYDHVPAEPGETVSYGAIRECKPADATYFVPTDLSGSDYSGSSYTRANFEHVRDNYGARVVELFGGYGTYAIAIPLDSEWANGEDAESLRDILASLADYPVIDEGETSDVEMQWSDEAWDSWARSDFLSELSSLYEIDAWEADIEPAIDARDCGAFRELFETLREDANVYWEAESSGMHVDIRAIVHGGRYDYGTYKWINDAAHEADNRQAVAAWLLDS
jgi:hypothetical protein